MRTMKMEMMMLMIRSFCSLSQEIVLHRLSPPAGCIPNAQTFETNSLLLGAIVLIGMKYEL